MPLDAILLTPAPGDTEPLYQRLARECWKKHQKEFQDCNEPGCVLAKRVGGMLGWRVSRNTLVNPATVAQCLDGDLVALSAVPRDPGDVPT